MHDCPKCKSATLVPLSAPRRRAPGGDPFIPPSRCSRCRGVLVRARVDGEHSFHLDRCPICSGIWFDAGEWAAIAASEWLTHLDDLWDPVWRKRVRERRAEKRHLETLEHALGEEAFGKVVDAVRVLRSHPMRSLGLSFLIDELRGPGR